MNQSQDPAPSFWSRHFTWKHNTRLVRISLRVGIVFVILLWSLTPGNALESHYAITGRAPFNQPEFYPIQQTLPVDRYRPIAPWVGRLVLPTPQQQGKTDWVWMEVTHAPPESADLLGKQVRLEWSQDAAVQRDVAIGTRDVKFDPLVNQLRRTKADLYADRLNGRSHVGPLQAIAGARPKDDVTVTLADATLIQQSDGSRKLQIATEPLLDTGRYYTLVKILGAVGDAPTKFSPKACPGARPCPSELFRVQHYNPATGQFDGAQETVRIPQQPMDGNGVYASTPRELEKSLAGDAGWYLYGAQDQTGLFTVQAIQPRSLFQLKPQQVLLNEGQALDYINHQNWRDTEHRKGTLQTLLINLQAQASEDAIASWKEDDLALVMHLFGGRGGKGGEGSAMGTVTGHFSYGLADVIRDPFTNELQLQVRYHQVYANNIEGVISGEHSWGNYMGNLQRGWLGTRPVADVLIKLDVLEDYDFGGNKLSPLSELTRQLRIISDRYRTGDGTGIASVTAATSCVQDSNQALFLTIQSIRQQVESSPAIQQWWSSHPTDPTVKRFERLIALGNALENELAPFGIVRQDWKTNATVLAGTQIDRRQFVRVAANGNENVITALQSWRTILPRQTQDELSALFLRHGAQLWFLRTNQVGGNDPDILPIAPTRPFGLWTIPGTSIPLVTILFTRILGAVNVPTMAEWSVAMGTLLGYGAIALPFGYAQGFLKFNPWKASWWRYGLLTARLLFMPALLEEFVFRVLLLPAPRAAITYQAWAMWAIVSLVLFIAYHPFNAKTFFKRGDPTFFQPAFLTLAGLLGVACTLVYWLTYSLLLVTFIHWVAVTVWLTLLGGMERLYKEMEDRG
ncbi:MAG: CPBP family intramembrane metalloprotease [Oscillatoriales cyanobacterium C42_A2020_001]|nr:CPBP family intramembrane metalloprotease [Leptolyngbyaceae cyanobacterium C42_A2020_001]